MNSKYLLPLALVAVAGCATPHATTPVPAAPPPVAAVPAFEQPTFSQTGAASRYGSDHQGKKTANGERFDKNAKTAAHRSLPFHTVARVTNLDTGQSVKVRITDRGPHVKGRIIDLSSGAASSIGMGDKAAVRVEVFESDQTPPPQRTP